jgi:hypothetical protein
MMDFAESSQLRIFFLSTTMKMDEESIARARHGERVLYDNTVKGTYGRGTMLTVVL